MGYLMLKLTLSQLKIICNQLKLYMLGSVRLDCR